ncbi:hypothetical protein ACHAXN_000852 [Cyclotella atomus]
MKLSTASLHLLISVLVASHCHFSATAANDIPPDDASNVSSSSSSSIPTISSLDSLPYDENGHLSTHILAIPSRCSEKLDDPRVPSGIFGHRKVLLEGEASAAVFGHLLGDDDGGDDDEAKCAAVCLEKGTIRSVVARPLPHRYWLDGAVDQDGDGRRVEEMTLLDFVYSDGCGKVEYGMVNYHERPVSVYWVSTSGEKIHNALLKPGERNTNFIKTFVGHSFQVYDTQPDEDEALNNQLLHQFTVENNGVIGFNNHRQPGMPKEHVAQEVQRTLQNEWDRHSKVKRTFSPLGFDKGRLPNDLYASLGSYYYNNRFPPHVVHEEWGRHKGVFVNYWEADVNFIQIPWNLKSRWQGRLKELVEAWTGVELETTDMYGMREYTKGARLVSHVDRESTHAASLIVNIAQENVTRPWTIEVNDHANRLHEVVMEPGDIVYYESAKSLHGRNTPLASGRYINLFTHYRPLNDPEWFTRDNPEGTPQPVLDVGECRLVGRPDQYSQGAVQCENDAIGPHLSPTMFRAKSAADLFQWWLDVGPKDDNSGESNVGPAGDVGDEL